MARKRKEEAPKGSPAWMATFSDLMNLLLCFFVLLFSMSSPDAEKWEQLVASFSKAFSFFNAGQSAIGEGNMIGDGTSQLSEIDEYLNSVGNLSDDNDDGENLGHGDNDSQSLEDRISEENFKETEKMLDKISEMTEQYNLAGYLELSMDTNGRYVEINISGSVLFDSGKANLKEDCLPLLAKVGDIIKVYEGHNVDIIGHTDNVPMHSARYESNDMLSSARAISTAQYLVKEKGIDINRLSWTGRGEYDPVASNATEEGRAKNRRVEIRIYNSLSSD